MTISALLTPELVVPALAAGVKSAALEELALHVGRVRPHVDRRRLAEALHERERQSTTALEDGVAVPHVRLPGLPAMLAALARSAAGIPWDAADGAPTRLFFLLVSPAEQPGAHLKVLATTARLLANAQCRARLLHAPTADDLLAVLRDHETSATVRAA